MDACGLFAVKVRDRERELHNFKTLFSIKQRKYKYVLIHDERTNQEESFFLPYRRHLL